MKSLISYVLSIFQTYHNTNLPVLPPPIPGETLKSYFKDLNKASRDLNVSKVKLARIFNGTDSITPKLAVYIERCTDTTAEYWLDLQLKRDRWVIDHEITNT